MLRYSCSNMRRICNGWQWATVEGRAELAGPDDHPSWLADREQLRLLTKNHHVGIEVGVSAQPIPIHFAFAEGIHLEGDLDRDRLLAMRNVFDFDVEGRGIEQIYPTPAQHPLPCARRSLSQRRQR